MTYGGRSVDLLLIKWKSSYVRNVIIHVARRDKQTNKQCKNLAEIFRKNMLKCSRPRNVNGQQCLFGKYVVFCAFFFPGLFLDWFGFRLCVWRLDGWWSSRHLSVSVCLLLDELLISGCRGRNLFSSTAARVRRASASSLRFIKNNLNKFPAESDKSLQFAAAVKYIRGNKTRNLWNIYQTFE